MTEIRDALKGQYGAALAMLRETVVKCPVEVWTSGQHPRTYWRIAYHAVFYTHLYLGKDSDSFVKWAKQRKSCSDLWGKPKEVEPYSKSEILEYIDLVISLAPAMFDDLDLSSPETGFSWYPNMTKLAHQLVNLRHIQGHVGQLSEILMGQGIETAWVGQTAV